MKLFTTIFLLITSLNIQAQLSPAITSWLQNTTETGSYYVAGNSTAIDNGTLYNCQLIEYSNDYVYVHTNGIPSYPTGPFQDGNPSQAQSQDAIFRIPLNPVENNGTPIETNPGNIGHLVLVDLWLKWIGIEMPYLQNAKVLIVLRLIQLWVIIITIRIPLHLN